MIHIVDYGLGNIRAFLNMYKGLGVEARTASTAEELLAAAKLILPGVGAFDHAMERLQASGMREALDDMVLVRSVPVLGVCVGMQILAKSSDEGDLQGLGWVDAKVRSLRSLDGAEKLPLPHMGWNDVKPAASARLFANVDEPLRFYFLHSFYFECSQAQDVAATTSTAARFAARWNRAMCTEFNFTRKKAITTAQAC